jgi:hypothetical protein
MRIAARSRDWAIFTWTEMVMDETLEGGRVEKQHSVGGGSVEKKLAKLRKSGERIVISLAAE